MDDIKEEQILIDTDGESIGKLNGPDRAGDWRLLCFGTPARISATGLCPEPTAWWDIEREVDLGRAIHLQRGDVAHRLPRPIAMLRIFCLTLSANIALEQSYGHIDGDSASLGEVCGLNLGYRQRAHQAVAGDNGFHQPNTGQVQSCGWCQRKNRRFFSSCAKQGGLNGEQGVIIPKTNALNLVLGQGSGSKPVSVASSLCIVYQPWDEALEILTGHESGQPFPSVALIRKVPLISKRCSDSKLLPILLPEETTISGFCVWRTPIVQLRY